jgi:ABC-type branched-subunit amino acid transport system permease subunit
MASVIGGSAMLLGPLIGGTFVVMVPFFLERMADFSYILKGVALIVVLWVAPLGVAELIGRPFARRRAKKLAKARGVEE